MLVTPPAPARFARQVWLFGGLQIAHNGRPIVLRGAKLQALFASLVLNPTIPHTRDALANRIWPDAAPERVRRFLSDALYRLRQALGAGWLEISGDLV
jgi:DNA-binding SARP family transcriptional activator